MYAALRDGNKIFVVSPVFSGNFVILWDAECLKEELKDKMSHQREDVMRYVSFELRKKAKPF